MITTKQGIHVVSYVHKGEGLADCDNDLTPEEKKRVATELKVKYCNELYRGKAVFEVAEEERIATAPAS